MEHHLFQRISRDNCRVFIVNANSEIEARGKLHKSIPDYVEIEYKGIISDLVDEDIDSGVGDYSEDSDVVPLHFL